jgi:hypothetical protein
MSVHYEKQLSLSKPVESKCGHKASLCYDSMTHGQNFCALVQMCVQCSLVNAVVVAGKSCAEGLFKIWVH